MRLIGTYYFEDMNGAYIMCNAIIELDSKLHISENIAFRPSELVDIFLVDDLDQLVLRMANKNYNKWDIMSCEQILEASKKLPQLISYLRNIKIKNILD